MNNNIRASKKINSELYKVEYWINLWKGLTYKNNYPRNVIISFKMLEYLMLSTVVLQRRPLPHYYFFFLFSQGIANGVLLITPHSVMFKPNVSDPLVMDRGQDTYSIATLMTSVTSAAMYTDIAAMAIHDPLKPGR